MRIVAVTRVLNEEDIIEAMVRHHAALVDHHVFLDNGSTDRTLDILHALAAEGIALTLLQNTAIFYAEESFNTGLYNFAVQQCAADWVCFLDCDEFVDLMRVSDLRSYLETVPQEATNLGLELIDYEAASPATAHTLNVVQRMVRRRPASSGWWKVFVRGGFAPARVSVAAGNHHVFLDGAAQPPLQQHDIRLAHFSNRSPYQWAGKAVIGRLKVLSTGQREAKPETSLHYVGLFEQLKRDPAPWIAANLDHAERMQTSDELTDDPIRYLGRDLLYTERVDYAPRAFALLMQFMGQMALELGAIRDGSEQIRARTAQEVAAVAMFCTPGDFAPAGYGGVVSTTWRRPPDAGFAALLERGWYEQEESWVWGQGTLHRLRLAFAPVPKEASFEIEFDVSAFLPPSRARQEVAVFLGAQIAASWIFTLDTNRSVRSVRVPAQPSITVEFRPSYAASPAAEEVASTDQRVLGVALWGVRKKGLLF